MRFAISPVVGKDRGLTLVELMVTMSLLAVILGGVTTTFILVARTHYSVSSNTDSLRIATAAMNRMTKSVRSGTEIQQLNDANKPAFAQISPSQLTVFASLNDRPVRVTYRIDAQRHLIEERTLAVANSDPFWSFPNNVEQSATIGYKIPDSADLSSPLFEYYDASGLPLGAQASSDPVVLSQVRSVRIVMTVQAQPAAAPPVQLANTVVLPNLGVVTQQ